MKETLKTKKVVIKNTNSDQEYLNKEEQQV